MKVPQYSPNARPVLTQCSPNARPVLRQRGGRKPSADDDAEAEHSGQASQGWGHCWHRAVRRRDHLIGQADGPPSPRAEGAVQASEGACQEGRRPAAGLRLVLASKVSCWWSKIPGGGRPSGRFFPERPRSSSRLLSTPDGKGARDENLVRSRGEPDGRAHQGRGGHRGRQRLLLGPPSRGAQGGGGGRDLEAGRRTEGGSLVGPGSSRGGSATLLSRLDLHLHTLDQQSDSDRCK